MALSSEDRSTPKVPKRGLSCAIAGKNNSDERARTKIGRMEIFRKLLRTLKGRTSDGRFGNRRFRRRSRSRSSISQRHRRRGHGLNGETGGGGLAIRSRHDGKRQHIAGFYLGGAGILQRQDGRVIRH